MGIGWEKPVFGWIQKLQIHIFCCPRDSKIRYFLYQGGSLPFCRGCIIVYVVRPGNDDYNGTVNLNLRISFQTKESKIEFCNVLEERGAYNV